MLNATARVRFIRVTDSPKPVVSIAAVSQTQSFCDSVTCG
jgi:hypothetical protein